MRKVLPLVALFAFIVSAAEISGTWKGSMETPNGTRETTMKLVVDGDKLTGTVAGGRGGEAVIENGKIEGDKVSFQVTRKFNDNEVKVQYKGTVSGDTMKLTVGMGERSMDMTLKKQ